MERYGLTLIFIDIFNKRQVIRMYHCSGSGSTFPATVLFLS